MPSFLPLVRQGVCARHEEGRKESLLLRNCSCPLSFPSGSLASCEDRRSRIDLVRVDRCVFQCNCVASLVESRSKPPTGAFSISLPLSFSLSPSPSVPGVGDSEPQRARSFSHGLLGEFLPYRPISPCGSLSLLSHGPRVFPPSRPFYRVEQRSGKIFPGRTGRKIELTRKRSNIGESCASKRRSTEFERKGGKLCSALLVLVGKTQDEHARQC